MDRTINVNEEYLEHWRSLPPIRMTYEQFKKLPEYSATNPTGVTVGKTWRRHNGAHDRSFILAGGIPRWVICRYEAAPSEMRRVFNDERRIYENKLVGMCARVSYRPVIKIPMGKA